MLESRLNLWPLGITRHRNEQRRGSVRASEGQGVCGLFGCPLARTHESCRELDSIVLFDVVIQVFIVCERLFASSYEAQSLFFNSRVHIAHILARHATERLEAIVRQQARTVPLALSEREAVDQAAGVVF